MKIFKNKTNTYKIDCDLGKNKAVRELAEKYLAEGYVVETRAHHSLYGNKPVRVTVMFESKEREPVIYKEFLEKFKNYDVKINGKRISIYKEIGF